MLEHIVLYTSDVHGNEKQLRAFAEHAVEIGAQTIILGGEIAPKDAPFEAYIRVQRDFLSVTLPGMLSDLKRSLPQSNIFVAMGNDDASANRDVLGGHPEIYTDLHGQRVGLNGDFDIVGYSCVPITPFGIKDWEKFDLSNIPRKLAKAYRQRKKENYRLRGGIMSSPTLQWMPFDFSREDETRDSIQTDLLSEVYCRNPARTVYVFHAPPSDSALDVVRNGQHVGSYAVREFIEKYQPYLTLHGHIHETVDMSHGKFTNQIGNTVSMSAGNHNRDDYVSALVFNLYVPNAAQRIKLRCR